MKSNVAAHFKTMALVDVPRSRNGKHKAIITLILRDLDRLGERAAFKVPLAELGDSKENVRSALNRATRKAGRNVATASDGEFLYVWNVAETTPETGEKEARRDLQVRKSGNSRQL